jgi:hypothetical protein
MAKTKAPLTREDLIEGALKTFKEIETTTRVRAWTFQANKKNYVLLKYRSMLDYVSVYESTRAGRRLNDNPIVKNENSTDIEGALNQALEILIPEITETQNS